MTANRSKPYRQATFNEIQWINSQYKWTTPFYQGNTFVVRSGTVDGNRAIAVVLGPRETKGYLIVSAPARNRVRMFDVGSDGSLSTDGGAVPFETTSSGPQASTVVKRAKDFGETGNYDVTLPSGRKVQIYRDNAQFSFAVWYVRDHDDQYDPRDFRKDDLVIKLEKLDAETPKGKPLFPKSKSP